MKRTNIMLTDEQHKQLKTQAKKEGKTLGELVREALDKTYAKKDRYEQRKFIAIEAYEEGFISIGKLSEILGLDVISTRLYLKDKGIHLKAQELEDIGLDAANA